MNLRMKQEKSSPTWRRLYETQNFWILGKKYWRWSNQSYRATTEFGFCRTKNRLSQLDQICAQFQTSWILLVNVVNSIAMSILIVELHTEKNLYKWKRVIQLVPKEPFTNVHCFHSLVVLEITLCRYEGPRWNWIWNFQTIARVR